MGLNVQIPTWLTRWRTGLARLTSARAPVRQPWERPYAGRATTDDIFHCFRLLLGRHPHREEWEGHAGRAGEELSGLVAGYLRSLEFANRGLLNSPASEQIAKVQLEDFAIYVAPDDLDVGRHVHAGVYEPDVTAVFRRLLSPGMNVLDIGANIGYFSMLSAGLVGAGGHVLAVEPNPANARLLEASRRLNGYDQVTVAQFAAGRETGLLALHVAQSNGTTSKPSAELEALLSAQTVPCIAIDRLVPADRRIDLIKVDVEGAEYNALLGCTAIITRDRPAIISEFSPEMMPGISGISGEEYLRWLSGLGYGISVIQPDGATAPATRDAAAIMAEYAARGRDHIDLLAT